MKIWYQHGSEHSANLVMIGRFEDSTKALKTKEIIDAIKEQVQKEVEDNKSAFFNPSNRYSQEMIDLLVRLNMAMIDPSCLRQFVYDVSVEVENQSLIITTDEIDIAAFMQVLFYCGARIEIYSNDDYQGEIPG
jgi:hypothetical protein